MRMYTRRALLGLALVTATSATTASLASEVEEFDPADMVPRRFSVQRFLSLTEAQIYDVNLAIRRGRRILIDGYSPSESREIITLAAKDPAAARARLSR